MKYLRIIIFIFLFIPQLVLAQTPGQEPVRGNRTILTQEEAVAVGVNNIEEGFNTRTVKYIVLGLVFLVAGSYAAIHLFGPKTKPRLKK